MINEFSPIVSLGVRTLILRSLALDRSQSVWNVLAAWLWPSRAAMDKLLIYSPAVAV
jgi:hypothetical protein